MKTSLKTAQVLLATLTLSALGLAGCSKESELDTIKDAQMCLNKATAGNGSAQTCVSKLSAIATPQANQLKCAAYFIDEGYGTPTKLIEAIEAAESGGGSSSINMISELSFSDTTQSAAAFEVCNTSGIAVYSQLSSLVQISTLAKGINPAASTPAEFATAVSNIPSAALGELVTETYASSCTSNSESGEALNEFCDELGAALVTSNSTQIGDCLKYKLGATMVNPGNGCPAN